jgi:hypothetical protein
MFGDDAALSAKDQDHYVWRPWSTKSSSICCRSSLRGGTVVMAMFLRQ